MAQAHRLSEVNGERKLIACAYKYRSGQQLGFELAAYDRAKPLIIDPVLLYSTLLGGNLIQWATGIAVDTNGNAYVVGTTLSTDFPTKHAFQQHLHGDYDTFVTKFDRTGSLVYSTFLGGTGDDQGLGIAVGAEARAYMTGRTDSTDFPTKNAFQNHLQAPPTPLSQNSTSLATGSSIRRTSAGTTQKMSTGTTTRKNHQLASP